MEWSNFKIGGNFVRWVEALLCWNKQCYATHGVLDAQSVLLTTLKRVQCSANFTTFFHFAAAPNVIRFHGTSLSLTQMVFTAFFCIKSIRILLPNGLAQLSPCRQLIQLTTLHTDHFIIYWQKKNERINKIHSNIFSLTPSININSSTVFSINFTDMFLGTEQKFCSKEYTELT